MVLITGTGLTEKWCGSSYDPMTDLHKPYDCYMVPQEVSPLFERRKHLIDPMCELMQGEMLGQLPKRVVENTGPNCSEDHSIDVQYQCVWPTLDGSESIVRGVLGARNEYFAFAEYELMHGNVHVPTYYCGTFVGRHLIGFFSIGRQEMGDQWFINVLHQGRAPLGFFTLIMSEIIDSSPSQIPINSPSYKGSGMLNYHKPNTSGAKHAYQTLFDVHVTVKEADRTQQRFRLCVQWQSLAWSFSVDMEKQPEKQGWYVGHVELQPPEAFHLQRKVVLTLWCLFSGLTADQGVVLFKAVGPTVIQPPNVFEIVPTMCMYGIFAFKT